MGVRTVIPSSILFTVELHCSTERRYRVSVTLDLQESYIFISSGVIPNISNVIEDFVSQLSEIASNQLALLKWDSTSDLTTEYQIVRVLSGYQVERSLVDLLLGDSPPHEVGQALANPSPWGEGSRNLLFPLPRERARVRAKYSCRSSSQVQHCPG
ncbi:MAG: hypothetical protein H7126_17340 [Candidatus Parcubacteria bacterium]|uniref:hypothetical protein n=1 Tax=Phormidesmis priestleyi TaxID=268141 RepID=UPI00083ABFF7|nr:hypothetical protein [Phormidesmis priestleyi]MBC7825589.1 hypothetical protein [Leptolyngbyaceae cyanobacterium LF-bin-113]